MTPQQTQKARGDLKRAIRAFFLGRDYDEVETPTIVPCPGTEAYLRFFGTSWTDQRGEAQQLWLRSSPELHMKQLLSPEMPRIFQMAPCFRNVGEHADWHHPEFTMLEWYRAEALVPDFLTELENLLRTTREMMMSSGHKVSLSWDKVDHWTVSDIFQEAVGINLEDQDPDLGAKAHALGVPSLEMSDDFETAFFKLLLLKVEPFLKQFPVAFLTDYPASQAALARIEGGVAKRFEAYVYGIELSNGFFELQDEALNRQRVQEAFQKRKDLGFEVPSEDQAFYDCLATYPESCGNALGFDRWLACLLGLDGIDAIIPFRQNIFTPSRS